MSVKLRERKLKGNRKGYHLAIYHNGKYWYEFLPIKIHLIDRNKKEKKELLESIRAKRELEINSQEYGFNPKFKKEIDFLAYYKNYLANYKKKDIRMIRYSMEKFAGYVGKERVSAKEITEEFCIGFRDYLQDESGLTGETPRNYFARFKKVIKKAHKEKIFLYNPTAEIIFKKKDGIENLKKEVLTSDELRILSATKCGNEEVRKAFLLACFTGLGMAEIRNLNPSKLKNGMVRLNREKSGEYIWNKLPPTALSILDKCNLSGGDVFDLPSDPAIRKVLMVWLKRSGIDKKISFYCGRHTYAVLLMIEGKANLKTVADCLGHASTKHTLKYLNYVNSLTQEAIDKLPVINI